MPPRFSSRTLTPVRTLLIHHHLFFFASPAVGRARSVLLSTSALPPLCRPTHPRILRPPVHTVDRTLCPLSSIGSSPTRIILLRDTLPAKYFGHLPTKYVDTQPYPSSARRSHPKPPVRLCPAVPILHRFVLGDPTPLTVVQSPSHIKRIQFSFRISFVIRHAQLSPDPHRLIHVAWSSIFPVSLPNRRTMFLLSPRSRRCTCALSQASDNTDSALVSPACLRYLCFLLVFLWFVPQHKVRVERRAHVVTPRPTSPSYALLVLSSTAASRLPRLLTTHTDARFSAITDPRPHPRPPTSSSLLTAIRSRPRSSPPLSLRRPQAIQIFVPPVHGILNKMYPNPSPRLPAPRPHPHASCRPIITLVTRCPSPLPVLRRCTPRLRPGRPSHTRCAAQSPPYIKPIQFAFRISFLI
ncbi:hypothetical protein C8J57DRAFT_1528501 [Mycena rebaudengoi]|nr:hypothetical protein C8J57DRAFT_1528501 [Mycena rebaudengoi]